ncbi:ATPase, histidine kinase-, DNA gyrase B (macronuclear) [Tetrahymena thermophila SB210]|uniref:histidine kinase n=1 Tax=Tetrahymena thermophila (strain SB210) TaxID=312017 RepID=I7MLA3_TETTS|nr:ATPase, histidine kinase-, DNA gyrase B [Tetrahymena thermophila SB210]EAS01465.2 ATPase, histidine kinase-, DNA gyrase B [Tetrahymena thermophila SB210]|eukprot:XP_001021711.2 ATPase, histidine kinase-, DNA gyrase B [Tetrahymena thermophila SB210]
MQSVRVEKNFNFQLEIVWILFDLIDKELIFTYYFVKKQIIINRLQSKLQNIIFQSLKSQNITRKSKMNLTTVIQEGIEKNFAQYYNKFTLMFLSSKMEKDYRNDTQKKNRFQLRTILLTLSFFGIVIVIWNLVKNSYFLIPSTISIATNILGYFIVKKYPFQLIELKIAFFSIFNQVIYDMLITNSNIMDTKNIILGEFFITVTICIYFRTRIFILDCLLVLVTRIIHLIFLGKIYRDMEIASIAFLIASQVSIVFFYFFQSEKNAREKYLLKNSHDQWAEIVDKVLPVNIIISKFNQRTCEIILGSCNTNCSKIFKIKDNETYNSMLIKMKIGNNESESSQSLRDYVLNKHFSIAERQRISRDKSTANYSLNEIDNQLKSVLALGQNLSSKKRQTDDNLHQMNEDKPKQFSIKSLNNLNGNGVQGKNMHGGSASDHYNRVESLIGYYKEKEFATSKKYKIKIYTVQGDNQSSLILSIEDKSHKSTLKFQKNLYSNTNHVFQKTLTHFQGLVKKAMTGLNEVSSKNIPTQVLYNTLILNIQINNIKDYLQNMQNQSQSKDTKDNNDDKIGSYAKIFFRNTNKFFNIETLGLQEMLSQLEKLMKKVCLEKQIQFILINETPEDLVIITDKNRLYRVLVNYISNSIEYTSKGYVQVKVSKTNSLGLETIKFQIIDSGKGINPKFESTRASNAVGTEFKSNIPSEEDISGVGAPRARLKQSINIIGFSNAMNTEREKKIQFNIQNSQSAQKNNVNINGIEDSVAIDSSMINLTQENKNSQMNSFPSAQVQQKQQSGLGIGLAVCKFLVNKLGPSFPKIFSKPGVGTNVTFEVYQDLKQIINSGNYKNSIANQPILPSQQRRHKNSSFSVFHNNNIQNAHNHQNPMINSTQILSNQNAKDQINALNNHLQNGKEALNSSGNIQSGLNINLVQSGNNQPNPVLSPRNQQSGSKESNMNLNKQSSSGGSNDYSINQGLSELKSKNLVQPLIHLDAQENIDEDALEYLNLGGNCYKMISGEEAAVFNLQKSEQYLNPNQGFKYDQNENLNFINGSNLIPIITGHHSNKKLSFIQAPFSNNTNNSITTISFANLQNHSQLFPFTLNTNDQMLANFQQPQFTQNGSKGTFNASSNNQNTSHNNNNNNSSMGSLPKIEENQSQKEGSLKNAKELFSNFQGIQQLQPSQQVNMKIQQNPFKSETPKKSARKQSIQGAYDKKIFRSSPDFLDPNNGPGSQDSIIITSPHQNPIQNTHNINSQGNYVGNLHLISDPSSHNSSHQQNPMSKFNRNQQQQLDEQNLQYMYLANIAEQINKTFAQQNGNQQGYQGRKLRQKSSFNLIFDQKTQMIEDPESLIVNTLGQGTQYGSKENNFQNESQLQIGSNLQNECGSQSNILISSSQSPVKSFSGQNVMNDSLNNQINNQQMQSQLQQLQQQQQQQFNQSSLSPYELKSKQINSFIHNIPSAQVFSQPLQSRSSQSNQQQDHLFVNSDQQGADSLTNTLLGSREKSVSIKLQVSSKKNSSILHREKELSGGNQSQTSRGYRISICGKDIDNNQQNN